MKTWTSGLWATATLVLLSENTTGSLMDNVDAVLQAKRGFVLTPEEDLKKWVATHFTVDLVNVSTTKVMLCDALDISLRELDKEKFGLCEEFETTDGIIEAFTMLNRGHASAIYNTKHAFVAFDLLTTTSDENSVHLTAATFASLLGANIGNVQRVPRGIQSITSMNELVLSPAAIVEELEKRVFVDQEPVDELLASKWSASLHDRDLDILLPDPNNDYNLLFLYESEYQQIEFVEHKVTKDVCLYLDNLIQICRSFDAAYSEVYVHLPAAFLPSLKRVLIVGGGDALALREVLEYASVERVVQLELDQNVPKFCQKYFKVHAHLPGDPTADPRVEWIFGDAAKTLDQLVEKGETFDIILMDISETDPSGSVSTIDFFRSVCRVLSKHGIFIKNDQNYQRPTAKLFNEFLEVTYPVPMIAEQTFVLGSNGTSLIPPPSFKVFDENKINTTFLAHGPSTGYRQIQGMVRRYQSRTNSLQEENNDAIPMEAWKCKVRSQAGDRLTLSLTNNSPLSIGVALSPSVQTWFDLVEKITPGSTETFEVYLNQRLVIVDQEKPAIELAIFQSCSQLLTHPNLEWKGLQYSLVAHSNIL